MARSEALITPDGEGVRLAVKVTPRATRNRIAGVVGDADGRLVLAVRLAAPPVDGAANTALIAFLAERAGLPKSAITIESGKTARRKIVRLVGISAETLSNRLETDPS